MKSVELKSHGNFKQAIILLKVEISSRGFLLDLKRDIISSAVQELGLDSSSNDHTPFLPVYILYFGRA